jgi:hypothetical protein
MLPGAAAQCYVIFRNIGREPSHSFGSGLASQSSSSRDMAALREIKTAVRTIDYRGLILRRASI